MNFFRKLFFTDIGPIIKLGRQRPLTEVDLPPLPDLINPKVDYFNDQDLNLKSPIKFLFSTIKLGRKELSKAYTWYFFSTIFSLLSPMVLNNFLKLVDRGVLFNDGPSLLFFGTMLGLLGILSGVFVHQYFFLNLRSYQILVNILNKFIFKHSLKLNLKSKNSNPVGDVVNHMSSDAESVADFTFIFADLVSNILLLVGIVIMLFHYLGSSTILSLIILISFYPVTKMVAKKFTALDDEMMKYKDQRINLMTQILNAIRVVKYFAFEDSLKKEILDLREEELNKRKKLAHFEVLSGVSFLFVSQLALFALFLSYTLNGKELNAPLIFTTISLFSLLDGPLGEMAHIISRLTNSFVAAKRIIHFLSADTKKESLPIEDGASDFIEVNHFSANYFQGSEVLHDINFKLKKGESLAIIGEVGAGKTSLLYALLEELNTTSGEIKYFGSLNRPEMAYVPQEAYIINSSLEENILFGESSDQKSIEEALYCSAFEDDIKLFNNGLKTEIGEKGVNLSGGQKQRVGLARAILSQRDLILLDDPISAVDHLTETKIMERLIFSKWKNKTRIMVTHRLDYLNSFDKILLLNRGRQMAFGTVDEVKQHFMFQEYLKIHSEEMLKNNLEVSEQKLNEKIEIKIESGRITEDEERETGAVKKSIYFDYIKSLGGHTHQKLIVGLLAISAIIAGLLPLAQKSWLSYYSEHIKEINSNHALFIYGAIGMFVLSFSVANNFFWLNRGIKAGKDLHDLMLKSIFNAPIRFFDSTPVGRILQRFSRDVESVDIHLQWSFVAVVNCILQVLISLGLIIFLIPYLILAIIPILFLYYKIQNDYRTSAREAKRLDSISRSPRFAHFKETLQGLIVIRSYKKEEWFLENFFQKLSYSQRMFYGHYMLNRWFSSRIPVIGGIISIITAYGVILFVKAEVITSGTAGLLTIYSLSFWGYLNWGVRVFSDIESRMTSVERLKFYGNIESEKSTIGNAEVKLDQWPSSGEIKIQDIKVRYAEHLPLVLKGLSFEIKGGTKVGIKGKTGSGKSTFFQTLFRFIELESGSIFIDGIDIKNVPLKKLRKSLAIIPQDPILFMGSIRKNLDRYSQYSDHEIYEALRHAGLDEFVDSLPQKLNEEVSDGGSNFSQGQRQLFCLARALLTKAKIIVMDEATASVDIKTDAQIQRVIREELKNITLIIIAHRLGTIKDCDQIFEINNGELVHGTY